MSPLGPTKFCQAIAGQTWFCEVLWSECPCSPKAHVEILAPNVVGLGGGPWGGSALKKETPQSVPFLSLPLPLPSA